MTVRPFQPGDRVIHSAAPGPDSPIGVVREVVPHPDHNDLVRVAWGLSRRVVSPHRASSLLRVVEPAEHRELIRTGSAATGANLGNGSGR